MSFLLIALAGCAALLGAALYLFIKTSEEDDF